jgi:hypothetical protein
MATFGSSEERNFGGGKALQCAQTTEHARAPIEHIQHCSGYNDSDGGTRLITGRRLLIVSMDSMQLRGPILDAAEYARFMIRCFFALGSTEFTD